MIFLDLPIQYALGCTQIASGVDVLVICVIQYKVCMGWHTGTESVLLP